jgi:hypothetical protein
MYRDAICARAPGTASPSCNREYTRGSDSSFHGPLLRSRRTPFALFIS